VLSVLSVVLLVPFLFSNVYVQGMESAKLELNAWTPGRIFLYAGSFLLVLNVLSFFWRLYLFAKYRPAPECSDAQLPVCTVIVPAFNEGKQVYATLQSLIASDYPAEKLEIIAVDDGSSDDTWKWIQKAAMEYPTRILALKQPMNKGKRHALYAGFMQGSGEVFVTVDSDSMVEPKTIRLLMGPIVHDPKVGGVAGNVRVMNCEDGIIARMLDVRFVYSFEFMRASQSMVNTVICTAGALSAYRRDVVMKVLPEWLNQTFMGHPANIGEDRSMTNHILREGYHVHFQRDAVVWTNVPVGFKNLCKMFLRWNRSNVRETLVMAKFIFKKFRDTPTLGGRINFLLQVQTLTISQIFFFCSLCCWVWRPHVFLISMLTGIALRSIAPAALYWWRTRNSDAIWAYAYGLLWVAGLSWIMPYALITPYKTSWLTRQNAVRPSLQMPTPDETSRPNTLAS
jgi:hyaluronan synthase